MNRRGRKADKTGRSTGEARYVQLRHYLLDSEAWRSLSPAARAVYVALSRRFNGSNNGRLALSVRDAGRECRITKDTACRAFGELRAKGFIACVAPGAFSYKVRHASEWRLTGEACDVTNAIASKDFMHWPSGAYENKSRSLEL